MNHVSKLVLFVVAMGTGVGHADELRFPLVLAATPAPAHFLVKAIKDNTLYRFEECRLPFDTEIGPLNLSVFDAVNRPATSCRPVDDRWRPTSDEAADAALSRALQERIARDVPRMNRRAKFWKLVMLGTDLYLASVFFHDWIPLGPFLRGFVGSIGAFSLLRDLPAYLDYRAFEIDDGLAPYLTAPGPSSDELRLTSGHTLRWIVRILRESLRSVAPPAPAPRT